MIAVARVSEFGMRKHEVPPKGRMDYLDIPEAEEVYLEAECRHVINGSPEMEGTFDTESKLVHKAHKAWCALADLEHELREHDRAQRRKIVETPEELEAMRTRLETVLAPRVDMDPLGANDHEGD
jgi:hypothetical protein